MTENQKKEQFSTHYLSALAALSGVRTNRADYDDGVDLLLYLSTTREYFGRKRIVASGKMLSVQLKSTLQKRIRVEEGMVKFDLESKNYNDLIFRRDEMFVSANASTPLILILLVCHDSEGNFSTFDHEANLCSHKVSLYWYYPASRLTYSDRKQTQRIEIPLTNKIQANNLQGLFENFQPTLW